MQVAHGKTTSNNVSIKHQTSELILMSNKEFLLQRICIYAGKDFDPASDKQVNDVLRAKFNVHLPQRTSMEESLKSSTSDHEIIALILQYRAMPEV